MTPKEGGGLNRGNTILKWDVIFLKNDRYAVVELCFEIGVFSCFQDQLYFH